MKEFKQLRIEDLVRIFWKRRWYFVLSTVLVGGLGIAGSWMLPPTYRSETTVLVESQLVPEDYVRSTIRDSIEDRINTIRQQLYSRSFLERIIEELALYGLGQDQDFVMENALEGMRKQILVTRARNTFVIAYHSGDPQRARDVTKRLADDILRINSTARKTQAIETDQFIDEELRLCASDLAAHEEKLKNFKLAHLAELPDQVAANLSVASGMQTRLSTNESALARAQDRQGSLERLLQNQARLSAVDLRKRPNTSSEAAPKPDLKEPDPFGMKLDGKRKQLSEASAKYTEKHPDVVQLAREVRDMEKRFTEEEAARQRAEVEAAAVAARAASKGGLEAPTTTGSMTDNPSQADVTTAGLRIELDGIRHEINTLQKERDYILSQIRVYEGRRAVAPRVEQELFALTREHDGLKRQHEELQQKKFKSHVAANLETSKKNETLKIIDEAYLPQKPVGPNRRKLALMAVAAGMLLGVGLIFGREYFDATIADENQAASELNLPILILIPEVSEKEIPRHRTTVRKLAAAKKVLPFQ